MTKMSTSSICAPDAKEAGVTTNEEFCCKDCGNFIYANCSKYPEAKPCKVFYIAEGISDMSTNDHCQNFKEVDSGDGHNCANCESLPCDEWEEQTPPPTERIPKSIATKERITSYIIEGVVSRWKHGDGPHPAHGTDFEGSVQEWRILKREQLIKEWDNDPAHWKEIETYWQGLFDDAYEHNQLVMF